MNSWINISKGLQQSNSYLMIKFSLIKVPIGYCLRAPGKTIIKGPVTIYQQSQGISGKTCVWTDAKECVCAEQPLSINLF